MFNNISFHYFIALLMLAAGASYLLVGASVFSTGPQSKARQKYLLASIWLMICCWSYGLMTVADTAATARLFWSCGFVAASFFFPAWLNFLFDIVPSSGRALKNLAYPIYCISSVLSAFCLTSDKIVFVKNHFGYQFSYGGLAFTIMIIYLLILFTTIGVFHIKWWRESRIKRQRKQHFLFMISSFIVAVPGFTLDYIVPTFTSFTVTPLAQVLIMLVSIELFLAMKTYNTLDITIQNVADYIFTSVTMPILVLNHENIITLANQAAQEFWPKKIIGHNIAELVFINNNRPEQDFFADNIARSAVTVVAKNGVGVCNMLLTIVRDRYGDTLSKVVVLNDITEMQNALFEAQDASRAKGDFLSRMSHEIRTPMNAIIGMTKIGQTAGAPEKMLYCLDKISDASRHLLGLINDILDMSKIEANKLEIIEEPFDLEKMLENISNVVAVKAEEKKLNLFIDLDPQAPRWVRGDELRLSQVITNFMSNAIKFTPDYGNVHLNIRLISRLNEEESSVLVEVIDDGIGISPEQQEKLFLSFEQAEGNTARRFGGTGLGLAISKRIIELMGGNVGVISEEGQGSCFYFTVNIKHDHDFAQRSEYHNAQYRNLRVLVIDDAEDVLDFFSRILTGSGINCGLAQSGAEAMEMVQSSLEDGTPYNIFFVDYLMEEMDGIETIQAIKNMVGGSMNVIMISVSDWQMIAEKATAAGVDRFIQKPLFRTAIFEAINGLIKDTSDISTAADSGAGSTAATFSSCHILLGEDIDINREIVLALLEDTKISIDCAENGEETLGMFSENQHKYDLILMDVQMPLMDGLTATRRIRALGTEAARNIPIIAMTANAFKEDVEMCREAGMNDHIGKPLEPDKLLAKMALYLRGKED